ASTALEPSFGVGVVAGALVGSHLSARLRGELALESFSAPQQTSRYLLGGAMMGVGGVLAGGCTIGAGLTGVSTLGLAPALALLAIMVGALAARTVLEPAPASAVFTPAE
ncbi:MAG: YeeE/YedE thiosulfate transporter family protein, partial [Pseudomonadota bacterium]